MPRRKGHSFSLSSILKLPSEHTGVSAIAWSADGLRLAAGCTDGSVLVRVTVQPLCPLVPRHMPGAARSSPSPALQQQHPPVETWSCASVEQVWGSRRGRVVLRMEGLGLGAVTSIAYCPAPDGSVFALTGMYNT